MNSVVKILKEAERFTIKNSPLLLTIVGTAGVISTAILAAQGGIKAGKILAAEHYEGGVQLTQQEKLRLTWKYYLPAAGTAVLTCGAVIGANQIGTRRAAALAAAYSLSDKAFSEYKEKVVEQFGKRKAEGVRDGVAQDRTNRADLDNVIVVSNGGDQLFIDEFSNQVFKSTMEDVKHAINRLNHRLNNDGYASISDFYDYVGIPHTSMSDDFGWTGDRLLDPTFRGTITTDQRPAIMVCYDVDPKANYFRTH